MRSVTIRSLALAALVGLTALALGGRADDKAKPSAKEVLAKHLQAIGGKEAILKHSSTHSKGKFDIPAQGIGGDVEVFHAKPNKLLVKVKIEGIGEVQQGVTGDLAWSINPIMGSQLLEGKMKEDAIEKAEFHSEVKEVERYKSMEVLGEEKFNNKDCWKVKLVSKSGKESTRYYDKKSGLMAGANTTQESPMGELKVTVTYDEYKDFGGIKMPAKTTQDLGIIQQVITINEVIYDQVDDKVFELPKEIKALVK
jgi:hypothetical protein